MHFEFCDYYMYDYSGVLTASALLLASVVLILLQQYDLHTLRQKPNEYTFEPFTVATY